MMNNETPSPADRSNSAEDQKNKEQQPLPFHNPLKADNNDKQVTQEDIENEQKYKEALSERD
ncbi:hypothetical protein [Segetibacter koreensis]|uniref:hypothetical protein n=1 Tax=Segetibacter koreensis TaxID=398037 RepID=UPI0003A804AD|nr:hypothetical protein [Segetibacter koreensis]